MPLIATKLTQCRLAKALPLLPLAARHSKTSKQVTMKNILLFLSLSMISVLLNGQEWRWLNPKPTGNPLQSVFFKDSLTGVSVGGCGTITKTIDGGVTWDQIASGTSYHLYAVYFANSNTGYAVGYNGAILKTTNGGTAWFKPCSIAGTSFYTTFFVNENIGYIAGQNGTIMKTTNGGYNWINKTPTVPVSAIYSLCFLNENIGFAAGYKWSDIKNH